MLYVEGVKVVERDSIAASGRCESVACRTGGSSNVAGDAELKPQLAPNLK